MESNPLFILISPASFFKDLFSVSLFTFAVRIIVRSHFKINLAFCFLVVLISSCKKNNEPTTDPLLNSPEKGKTIKYIIQQGAHYCDQSTFEPIAYNELNFTVRFDSSAIYQTADPSNQEDINKLYGFSDNNANHEQFSARFGWNWVRGALRLYAYVYNNGARASHEITAIQIGTDYACSINVSEDHYVFSTNKVRIEMPRESKTLQASGYKLFPYFGGDETAPHEINIWIKEL